MKRVFFDILLFLSVFIFPWWVAVILALVGIFVFKQFYEFIALGMIMSILYAVPGPRIISSVVWFPVVLVVVYMCIQLLRKYIIIYKNEI